MNTRTFRFGSLELVLFLMPLCLVSKAMGQNDAAAIYKAKCAVCHGANGDANTNVGKAMKLRDLRSAEVQKQTDAQLYTITCCGKGKMPGYQGKLTEEQINEQVAYLRALAAKK